jgi:selenocysteine-specific elongation factor
MGCDQFRHYEPGPTPLIIMRVIGTAGHVDHGKSTLVEALTGTHPDRLKEEKLREMTIDLGFAWMKLPDDEEVGIVDVPGHRDFIENMLAGVGGMDCVLFVVAGDEGVMPQTREHLAILDLLEIPSGLLVITKIDKVADPAWLDEVEKELRQITLGTVLEHAPLVRVSALAHTGLDELIASLGKILSAQPRHADLGRPRLPVDRVFSIQGFGTIVTGTLRDGTLNTGDEVEVLPVGLKTRIRGLQTHNHKATSIPPGSRAAANLTNISVDQVQRGDVVCLPGMYQPTRRVDVSFRLLPDASAPLQHDQQVKFFVHAAETTARVRLLGVESLKPGENGWLQLETEHPVCVERGDRFILRRPSPGETLGGGIVDDPHPAGRHKRFNAKTVAHLNHPEEAGPEGLILTVLRTGGFSSFADLVEKTRLETDGLKKSLTGLIQQAAIRELTLMDKPERGPIYISTDGWQHLIRKARGELDRYHENNSLRAGMPREELKSRLKLEAIRFNAVIKELVGEGVVELEGTLIRRPGWSVRLSDGQRKWLEPLMARFAAAPYAPPPVSDCISLAGADLYHALVGLGDFVPVSEEVVFRRQDYQDMLAFVQSHLKSHRSLTVAEFRDHFKSSRKYALAFLEHLDAVGVTVREGDFRRLKA